MTLAEKYADRHPGTVHMLTLFDHAHLSGFPHRISAQCSMTAEAMVRDLPDGPELTAGLRKLWEAKNSFVVCAVEERDKGRK